MRLFGWVVATITRRRVRALRRAKLAAVERFKLAMDHGQLDQATAIRHRIGFYVRRIEALTGESETVLRSS